MAAVEKAASPPADVLDVSTVKPKLFRSWRDEIPPLCFLIWLRLLGQEGRPGVDVRDPAQQESITRKVSADQREFVERRVAARIMWYAKAVDRINNTRDVVSGTIAAGGALIASITAIHQKASSGLSWPAYVVIGLGVVVAVLGAVSPRVVRAEQIERYRRGGNRLRTEAWQFALKRGRYSDIDDVERAFAAFVDEVDTIESEAIATESDITHEK